MKIILIFIFLIYFSHNLTANTNESQIFGVWEVVERNFYLYDTSKINKNEKIYYYFYPNNKLEIYHNNNLNAKYNWKYHSNVDNGEILTIIDNADAGINKNLFISFKKINNIPVVLEINKNYGDWSYKIKLKKMFLSDIKKGLLFNDYFSIYKSIHSKNFNLKKDASDLLRYAIKKSTEAICILFIDSGKVNLNDTTDLMNSYLYLSMLNKKIKVLKSLLDKNINTNVKNNKGQNILHLAVINGSFEAVKLISKNNKELIFDKSKDGATPVHLAVKNKDSKTINFFKKQLGSSNKANKLKALLGEKHYQHKEREKTSEIQSDL